MKHRNRTLGTLCLTGLFCLSLTACGGKAPEASKSDQSSAPDTSEPVARSGLDHLGHHQRPEGSRPDGCGKGSLCLYL